MDAVADIDKADEKFALWFLEALAVLENNNVTIVCQMSEDKNLNDKPHYSKSIWWLD